MARPRVRLDGRQVRKALTSNAVVSQLDKKAQQILDDAKSRAPVQSGAYRDSLKVEHDVTDRSVVRVVADIEYGLAVEAQHAVLGVALNMNAEG